MQSQLLKLVPFLHLQRTVDSPGSPFIKWRKLLKREATYTRGTYVAPQAENKNSVV